MLFRSDLVLTAGAGDIWAVGEGLLGILDLNQAKANRNGISE